MERSRNLVSQWMMFFVDDGLQQFQIRSAFERAPPGKQLIQNYAERKKSLRASIGLPEAWDWYIAFHRVCRTIRYKWPKAGKASATSSSRRSSGR